MTQKVLCISFGVALAVAMMVFASAARANELNEATKFTIDQPFEVPGNVALGAGTYWFVAPEGIAAPDVVHIFNADRTELLATVMTIPTLRPKATGYTELTFAEQSPKQPAALISWFYPGLTAGHEFLYSPSEGARLSESEQVTVMAQTVSPGASRVIE